MKSRAAYSTQHTAAAAAAAAMLLRSLSLTFGKYLNDMVHYDTSRSIDKTINQP
jgi:hypothetical protein